jgi:lipopolysaccharide export system permease protein
MISMPRLLYRYMLSELLRVFFLTLAILVTVIAFGATIRPLTSDHLLTAADVVKYMCMAMVPMMQFALPFAAGFASTIVLHRMSNDNEILAAAASGISYRRLLAPIAALGLVLSSIMVGLTQYAIPQFWSLMERTITTDVTKLFQASIDRGVPFEAGGVQIFADGLRVVPNPPDTDAETRLILSRVAAIELDRSGRIDTDVTAQRAVVDIYRDEGQTLIMLAMQETMQFDGGTGQLAYLPLIEPPRPIIVPHVLRDQLRAMTRSQLLRLRDEPDRHSGVRELRDELAQELADRELWQKLEGELAEHGRIQLAQRDVGRRQYVIHGSRIRGGFVRTSDGGPVAVMQYDGTTPLRRITAEQVRLSRIAATGLGHAAFEIELLNCEVVDLQSPETVNRRERLADSNLVMRDIDIETLPTYSSMEVLAKAHGVDDKSEAIRRSVERLEMEIEELRMEVRARIFMRYAQSTTALMLLLIGAVLAMVLRGSLPLVIYLWAFIPSILCLILISGGDKMMRDGQVISGVSVMWSGNTAMLLMLILLARKLFRN